MEHTIDILRTENKQIKNDNVTLIHKVEESCEATTVLKKELNLLEQYNRQENIEISGLPETICNNELESVIIDLLRRIGLHNLEHFDIVACHRLKS